jgi:5-histidylcysteine sulfoxide synthase/putative 4-mercaptohistidine N1-methyltranferase
MRMMGRLIRSRTPGRASLLVAPSRHLHQAAAGRSQGGLLQQQRLLNTTVVAAARPATADADEGDDVGGAAAPDWKVNIRGSTALKLVGPRQENWFTGKKPGECPGTTPQGKIYGLAAPNITTLTRQQLRDYFDNSWTATEVLFSSLQGEEPFFRPPYHNLRHPKIFYYAHPAVVYINKLRVAGLIENPLNEYFESVFAVGVDEMQWDDLSKNDMNWPSIDDAHAYRREVYRTMTNIIETHPGFDTIKDLEKSQFWAVLMGIEHEKIHLETSSVLMRELPLELVRKPEGYPEVHPSARSAPAPSVAPKSGVHYPANEFLPVASGQVQLGKPKDFPSYGWDNEYGRKTMHVKSFRANKYKVTNGEFHEFVKSGGYLNEKFWEKDGWKWRCYRNVKWPTFWVPAGPAGLHQYRLRAVFEEVNMPWSWPVIVNYHEAKAFANWRSEKEGRSGDRKLRLLSEPELALMKEAAIGNVAEDPMRDPALAASGAEVADKLGFNLNLAFGSESPVDALKPDSNGFHDVIGNVWEWGEDHMSALPGFAIHPFYDDFTLPCFDGQHNLILGNSFMSCGDEASTFGRYQFRPHFFQHSGFRLVEPNQEDPALVTSCMDNQGPFVGNNPFRSTKPEDKSRSTSAAETLRQYLHVHYNSEADRAAVPAEALEYPKRVADVLINAVRAHGNNQNFGSALEVGCSVGRSSLELSRVFQEVQAFDLSPDAIAAANTLKEKGELAYTIPVEGEFSDSCVARVPAGANPSRVIFKQADAMCLPADLQPFDGVLLANIVCQVPAPKALLGRFGGARSLVKRGGIVVVSSPYVWNAQRTPKELWLGGHEENGRKISSVQGLKETFAQYFDLVDEVELPYAIRQEQRKFEYLLTNTTVWRLR